MALGSWKRVKVISRASSFEDTLLPLAELKAWLQVDDDLDDTLIESIRSAALGRLEGPNGAGLALLDQSWTISILIDKDVESEDWLEALGHPFKSWTSVKSRALGDQGGDLTAIDGDNLYYSDEYVRYRDDPWPNEGDTGVEIVGQYSLGYGAARSDVPNDLLLATKMIARQYYDYRDGLVQGAMSPLPSGAEGILADYRRF